jgi:hypothetical protein
MQTMTTTTRIVASAVGAVLGAALVIGGLNGAFDFSSTASGAVPLVTSHDAGTPAIAGVETGERTDPALAGAIAPAANGSTGAGPGGSTGGGRPAPGQPVLDPPVVDPPAGGGGKPEGPGPVVDPPLGGGGKPKGPGPIVGNPVLDPKPEPVIRDHRGENPGGGGVVVTPSGPTGSVIRDHRNDATSPVFPFGH